MRKPSFLSILATGWLGCLAFLAPVQARAQCFGLTIPFGTYSLLITGSSAQQAGKFLSGLVAFNGFCGFSGNVSYGENNATSTFVNISGSYSQKSDKTIALSFTLPGQSSPETYEFGYIPGFGEGVGVETDSWSVATLDLQLQASFLHFPYNNGSVKGVFAVSCAGVSGRYSNLNYVSFDGNGNVSGTDDYNNFAVFGSQPYTGTYAVQYSGALSGNVTISGGPGFGFAGALTNNANELHFIYLTSPAPSTAITACTGKRVR